MIYATALLLSFEDRSAWAYGSTLKIANICSAILANRITNSKRVQIADTIVHIAEEMFDLSNNPAREDERGIYYGKVRSVSVGDVIKVEYSELPTEYWLCCSTGWKRIDLEGGCLWVAPVITELAPKVKERLFPISDKIIKHIADLGYIQRDDGKIIYKDDAEWSDVATTYDNMEDLIMSALTRLARTA